MMAIDLSELLLQVKENLEEGFPEDVWVRAEVASIQVKGSPSRPGHCYLELCDSGQTASGGNFFGSSSAVCARVKAIAWQYNWLQISQRFRAATGGDIEPGIRILANVRVNFSELYGLSLIIEDVDPSYSLGDAEARRRETIARLVSEELMGAQKELPLATLPRNLAVITSATAAGYGDFCRHLEQNEYGFSFNVTLFEAIMQGDAAPASIVQALEGIGAGFDAVLILRGGGSVLDLACFDDYDLCAAIARCDTPVFTAIGHDRDMHVADLVAWQYVKTPTALADLFISAFAEEDERICAFGTRLRQAFSSRIGVLEMTLERIEARIKAADPRSVLKRGYTLTTDSEGRVCKTAASFKDGDRINIMFPDGTLNCTVNGRKI